MADMIIDSAARLVAENDGPRFADWLKRAETWGIARTIIAPDDACVAALNGEGNARMVELMKKYPAQISGLAVANPWFGKEAARRLRTAFDQGSVGLYLCPGRQGFRLSEAIVYPLIEICREYDKPVYCYTGTPVFCMPFQLAELARRFPEVSFALGHFAWSDFCGYDAVPAAQQTPNLWIETSCAPAEMVRVALDALGADRLLFGTGFPRSTPEHEFKKIETLNLTPEVLTKYTRANARRFWKLKEGL